MNWSVTGMITIHLDAEQAGVGTATCGPGVLLQYLVPVESRVLNLRFIR